MFRAVMLAFALGSSALLFAGDAATQAVAGAKTPPPSAAQPSTGDQAMDAAIQGQPCSDYIDDFPPCGIPKPEKKKARKLYDTALKLASHHELEDALSKMKEARAVSPQDTVYAAAEKAAENQLASDAMKKGTEAMRNGDATAALKFFQRAVQLDPANEYAVQRLHTSQPPQAHAPAHQSLMDDAVTRLKPNPGVKSFSYKGSSAEFLSQFVRAYGLQPSMEEAFITRQIRVTLDDVDWDEGSEIAARACKALIIPMGEKQVLLANDTEENRRDLLRMELRSFSPSIVSTPQELNEIFTAMRVLFDLRFISMNGATGTIVVRAPQQTMDALVKFMDSLEAARPSVMLQIRVFELSTDVTRDVGISAPTQFTAFNIPSEVDSLLTSSSYSSIVSELSALGQSANITTILAALLASGSSSGVSNPLSSPFATFGNGITLSGVTMPSVSAKFSTTRSEARTLDDIEVRTEHGNAATLKVGERYPIVTTQYSTTNATSSLLSTLGISTSALGGTLASELGTGTTPSPQFQYEDIGLVLKATPRVHGKLVSIEYEMTVRAVGATQSNGLPLLTNRELKGVISTDDGESVVMAGLIDKEETASLNGIPGLSAIPGLGSAFSTANKEKIYDELLIVMTPRIVAGAAGANAYILVPTKVPK
jgi:type II secretory pathway component GspD/PulD (secretin)